jgi:uroporphyrinogen-III synthase
MENGKSRFEIERQKAIERVTARGGDVSRIPKTASEFLDRLTEMFCDTTGISTEELKADLEERGIDTEKAVAKIRKLIEQKRKEYDANIKKREET